MTLFRPKIIDTLRNYSRQQFYKDAIAGVIVGIVAIPLAIAFAIASGVTPEKGFFTAIVAGFIISVLGGSRVQIGGPTGAFIVVVYGIVQQFGISGLIIATFMAGLLLIVMGFARLGSAIKFIPYPLIVGFTSGIAVIIFSSQVKDLFGLKMGSVPADFISKWIAYGHHFSTVNLYAIGIGIFTCITILLWPRVTGKVPGSLIAILITTLAVSLFHLPVETIGSRFGSIPSTLPRPVLPGISLATIQHLIRPAFTIALLGSIESLLSAVVADSMIGGNHRSNTELIAQGIANICSSVFGGIPATGAIARTATNIKNGARTPVAGIIHALTLLFIMMFFGKWAALIPMPALAGILMVVAWNMSEVDSFGYVLKGPKSDITILLTTFTLTIFIDLTVAIEIGMILAAFLFLRKMVQSTSVLQAGDQNDDMPEQDASYNLPLQVAVFEINGPLFFGAAWKFKEAIRLTEKNKPFLIIRMRNVPIIDSTGIRVLTDINEEMSKKGGKLILAEVNYQQVINELQKTRLLFKIGKANVTTTFDQAMTRADTLIRQLKTE
ncbi:SulP family inorganic anion transporter [Mucilaginibacter sp.]|jgi:SulP family sulfate permease|uniref:SulP family inorganic anion transporter n=1 Tax=Mucilaginibacter sp. TaxID=1882438 RepID=UPI002B6B5A2E|nr:SulP family inorganic anion transporter [Mucilaginibacter sp.]HTI59943.1 SulP family inorganic anion transporter [Mucilaginibacter sp.]